MALGKKKTYAAKVDDSVLKVTFRRLDKVEEGEYIKARHEFKQTGRRLEVDDHSPRVKGELFDLAIIALEGEYENANGEVKPFTLENPIPPDEIKRLKEVMQIPGEVKSQLDLIPVQFKMDAVTACFDYFETVNEEDVKKNSFGGSKPMMTK